MFLLLVFSLLCVSSGSAAEIQSRFSSISSEVGTGGGTAFSSSGPHVNGHITGLKVWELVSNCITGIQIKYGDVWSPVYGLTSGQVQELHLYANESIIQVSGKHNDYVYQLAFVTNMGRQLIAGQPSGWSFNFYPEYPVAELRYVGGRFNSKGITSMGFHWGLVYPMSRAGEPQLSEGLASSTDTS